MKFKKRIKKNSREDYEDKKTKWEKFTINQPPNDYDYFDERFSFHRSLEDVLINIQNYLWNMLDKKFEYNIQASLKDDNSYLMELNKTSITIWPNNPKILQSDKFYLAGKLEDPTLTLYSRLYRSKKWQSEIILSVNLIQEGLIYVIMNHFPQLQIGYLNDLFENAVGELRNFHLI